MAKRIHYKKTFLSGNLEGLTADASFVVNDEDAEGCMRLLREGPRREAVTGSRYTVSGVYTTQEG